MVSTDSTIAETVRDTQDMQVSVIIVAEEGRCIGPVPPIYRWLN